MSKKIKIIAYKGMDENMTCRGKKYEVGKTYTEDKAKCCHAGMHACENPLDVLHYYPLKDNSRFFEVECGGNVDKSGEDSKLACTELTVKGELNLAGLIKATVGAIFKRAEKEKTASSGDSSTAASSGDCSTAASSGGQSTAASSGDSSTAGTSGDCSTAASSGWKSTAASSGDSSTAGTSGDCSTAASSGGQSTAGTSGDCSTAAATGSFCMAKAEGKDCIAVANGYKSKARGAVGCYLVLTEYDDVGHLLCADLKLVNGVTIKADTWYMLKNGQVVEAKP